ncbi:MAG: hypothetical protein DRQ78_10980 [Epsilonproteobacteria bacterium]|nr:MAG: hypothetical protein DRQ78_10980 [Campylobacterota bacterium]
MKKLLKMIKYSMLKLLLLFLMPFYLFAIDINEHTQKLALLAQSSIWIDDNNTLSKNEVVSKKFEKCQKNALALGYAPHRAAWIKFTLRNTSSVPLVKILSYEHPLTQSVSFYEGKTVQTSGFWHRKHDKKYFLPSFKIKLQAQEEKTFYLKVHSEFTTLVAKITLWEAEMLKQRDDNILYMIIIFLSIVFTLLVYNLVIYFFTKDKAYIYYILYLLAMLLAHSFRSSIFPYFLLSDETTVMLTQCISIIHALFIVSIIMFTREFLDTYSFPKLDKILKFYLYYIVISSLLTCYHLVFDMRIMLSYVPLLLVLMFAGFHALHHGKKEALFYLIGWSFIFLAILSTPLRSLGFFNIVAHISYPYTMSFILEAFFFSFALAYKIKALHKDNQNKQEQIISFQKEEQTKLEKLVEEKTKDIHMLYQEKGLLYQELNHRVKNNLQMILSLVKLQISTASSSGIKEALGVTKNRINSFATLYESMHSQEDMKHLDTKTHFTNIINHIMPTEDKHITIRYRIEHNLQESALLYAGLIVNELATNAFKYAFATSGTFSLSLTKEQKTVTFILQDNGKGFEKNKNDTLGLSIVRTLVEKQLYGTIEIDTSQGTKITMKWEEND